MGPVALCLSAALLTALGRGAAASGSCIPWVMTSGSCALPVQDASACASVAAQWPLFRVSGSVKPQQAPDRPPGCWFQESNNNLWFNTDSSPMLCSDARRCVCCSPYTTNPMTVTAIDTPWVVSGIPTTITLTGAIAAGDKVAWAPDCSSVTPVLNPGGGGANSYTLHEEGVHKLCYQAAGTGESVPQVGIELEVVTACIPEFVTSGPSGVCQWPISSSAQCSYRASLHGDVADGSTAVSQDAYDRPSGCWFQPANGGLFFNVPSGSDPPVSCTEAMSCVCCKVTTTATTTTGTTVTTTTFTTTTATTTATTTTISTTTSTTSTTRTGTRTTVTATTTTTTTSITATETTTTSTTLTVTSTTTTTTSTTSTTRTGTTTTTTGTTTTTTSSTTTTGTTTTSTTLTSTTSTTATSTTATSTTLTTTTTSTSSSTTTSTSTTTTSTTTLSTTTTTTTTTLTSTTRTSTTTLSTTTTTTTTTLTSTTRTSTTTLSTTTTTTTTTLTSTTRTSTTTTTSTTSTTSSTTSTTTPTTSSSTTSSNTTTSTTTTSTRSTTTSTSSTTTTTRSDTYIHLEIDVANLDYHRLTADTSLTSSFEDSVKTVVVFEAREGAFAHMIDVVLSPGSTRVDARVYVEESEQRRVYRTLAYSSSLQTNMQESMRDVPRIDQVSSGLVEILSLRVLQVASACGLFVCPNGFDDRPVAWNSTCSNMTCTAEECCGRKAPPPYSGGGEQTSKAGLFVAIGFGVFSVVLILVILIARHHPCGPRSTVTPEVAAVGACAERKDALAVEPAPPEDEAVAVGEEAHEYPEGWSRPPKGVAEPRPRTSQCRTCPKGHALHCYTVPWSGDFSCDRCGEAFMVGAAVYTCNGCHYDLCSACAGAGEEELPLCPRGHTCSRFALEPGDGTPANCSRCLKGNLAKSCPHFFRCGVCLYDLCPDCKDPSKVRGVNQMEALMQALALAQEQAQMVAKRPPESVVLQSAEHAAQLDSVDLQLLQEGHDSTEVGVEAAIRTVNATSTELSRIMGEVQVAPTGAKPALLAAADALEHSEDYLRARHMLQSLTPAVLGVDPFGGVHMG